MESVYLVGDIGGTNCRLRMVAASRDGSERVILEKVYQTGAYPSLTHCVRQFMEESECHAERKPLVGVVGIAGPVENNACKITNVDWPLFSGEGLAQDLGIGQFLLLNDFVANGYGLLGLQETDFRVLQAGSLKPGAPKALIGAGTGLGEAFLTCGGEHYDVWPCEGGHTDFAPRDQLEMDLLLYLRNRLQITHVSVERVVSGPGIAMIYDFFTERRPDLASPAAEEIRASADQSAVVSRHGIAGTDDRCKAAMDLFISLYGAEAGNQALKLLPYGGLYVSGGIITKIMDRVVAEGDFLEHFLDKGRMRRILQHVPVYLVTVDQLGMLGAQVMAKRLLSKA